MNNLDNERDSERFQDVSGFEGNDNGAKYLRFLIIPIFLLITVVSWILFYKGIDAFAEIPKAVDKTQPICEIIFFGVVGVIGFIYVISLFFGGAEERFQKIEKEIEEIRKETKQQENKKD